MKKILLLALLFAAPAWADSMTFQWDGTADDSTYDAQILERSGQNNDNYGALDSLRTAGSANQDIRSVIRFPGIYQEMQDCGVTPAEIDSGKLELRYHNSDAGSDSVAVYTLTEHFQEGTGTGLAADTADVSWLNRDHVINTSDTAWTTAGGGGGVLQSTIDLPSTDTTGFKSWSITKAACSTWVAAYTNNYGLLLDPLGTANIDKFYRSRNYGTAADRPKFTLYWTRQVPGEFGNTTTATVVSWGVGVLYVEAATSPSTSGTLDSLRVRISNNNNGDDGYKLVIYNSDGDDPTTLVDSTALDSIKTNVQTIKTLPVQIGATINASTEYFLGLINLSSTNIGHSAQTTGGNNVWYKVTGSIPDPFGAQHASSPDTGYGIYAYAYYTDAAGNSLIFGAGSKIGP